MKAAYFDCFSGISGDMILGALIDSGLDIDYLKKELKKLALSGYEINTRTVEKKHITGTKVDIIVKEDQNHRNLKDINKIIDNSALDSDIKETSKKIFMKLAQAESKVHNTDINKVHFHEVGALDSILDIVGVIIALKKLEIKKIYSSDLHLGSGFVKCAHGMIPVPAPATTELLKGIPVYSTGVKGELVTPTGAAIITSLAISFDEMPNMTIRQIGYGAGKSDFRHPNLLRIFIGDLVDDYDTDTTNIIETNIDDMNPEYYDHIIGKLLDHGALDVYLTNIHMKNNRPAIKLSVISTKEDTDKLTNLIFTETTTFGVRIHETKRKKLFLEKKQVKTKYGAINIKIGSIGTGIKTISPEYKDCKKIADEKKIPLKDIYDLAKKSYLDAKKDNKSKKSHENVRLSESK